MKFRRGNGGGPVLLEAPAAPDLVACSRARGQGVQAQNAAAASRARARAAREWAMEQHRLAFEQGCAEPGAWAPSARLSDRERLMIGQGCAAGMSVRAIARALGRSASTICRGLNRNSDDDGSYVAARAADLATERARRPKKLKVDTCPRLRAVVVEMLNEGFSPEQVSGRLRRLHPDDEGMHISHEAVYQALYVQGKGALRQELKVAKALRSGRTARRPRSPLPPKNKRSWVDGHHISLRPAEAEDRAVPGHWEGDLILGAGNRSATITLAERTTRFVLLGHLSGRHDADSVEAV